MTATIKQRIEIPDAKFLVGITAMPNGSLLMADMLASRIVALHDGEVRTVQEGPELQSPARLAWTKSGVIVAPWGYTTNYKTDTPGELYTWRMEDRHMEPLAPKRHGNWIGLCTDGKDGWFAGDFQSGTIVHLAHDGRCQDLTCLEYGLGGILFLPEHRLLLAAHVTGNFLVGFRLEGGNLHMAP